MHFQKKAPAVLRTINITIPEVDESALHIRDARKFRASGKFIPEVDSIFPDKIFVKTTYTPKGLDY